MTRCAVALGILVLLQGGAALAAGSAAQGHALAEKLCSRCHAIQGSGPSPVAEAPPFSGFSRRWSLEDVGEALAEGIMTGHGKVKMPEFTFHVEQIDDLLAYLASVQR